MEAIKSKAISFLHYGKSKIIKNDLYPTTITFTYDGQGSFKTFFGGIISILIQLIALIIAIMLISTIFQRGKTAFSFNKVFRDLTYDLTKHYFAGNNETYFAIKLTGPTPEKLLDPSYFSFHVYQSNYIKTNNSQGYSVNSTEIEYELCGEKFPYVQKEVYDRIGLSTYICPKNTDFYVRSNFNSENFQTIQISIDKCTSNSCKSSSEISNVLKSHSVNVAILSSYFDVNDYDNPIHHYLQDKNMYFLTSSVSQRVEYKIKQNQVFLSDSIWFGSQGSSSEINFYSLDKGQIIISDPNTNYYLQFFIFLDQQIEQNQRTVYSFLDMFGFIGGIFGVLYKVGVVIVGVISKKIFYASVFQTLFHEESKQISKNENLNNKDVKENVKRERFLNEGNRSSIVIPFQVDENRSQSKTSLNEREESKFEINNRYKVFNLCLFNLIEDRSK